ncbi:MAG TPA: Calx-beta domain-containing protein, partial [Pyrinomonadaceae bacterium]
DAAFGSGGKSLIDFGGTADSPAGVVVQADGKLVVVGSAYRYNDDFTSVTSEFVLARLNADGTPDATYGAGGKVKATFNTPFPAYPLAAAIQPDGRVLAAGILVRSNEPFSYAADFFVARFNADGTPDASFGTQGHAFVDFAEYDIAFGVALQPDGKVVLAGMSGDNVNHFPSTTSFALARLKADGTPDATFDGDGRVTTTFLGQDAAYGVALQPDGKIVAAGSAGGYFNSTEPDFALARYEENGALDPTFGAGGRATLDFDSSFDSAVGVAVAPGGRILAGGYTFPFMSGGGPRFAAARFNPDGSPDNTFGTGGRATTSFPGDRAYGRGMAAQPDGRFVIVGDVDVFPRRQANVTDIAVARYGSSPAAEPTSFARFTSRTYAAAEGCVAAVVTVSREGDLSAPAAVEFRTRDGSAQQVSDYTHTTGTLDFAAGESSKIFAVPVNDDAYAEGTETIRVELVGGSPNVNFRVPADAALNVADDDAADGKANPLDNPRAFVCQHYHDFLSREPDAAGLQFWTQGIESCGADQQCREVKRIDVSTAFFLSIEFQQTGYFVIRAHKTAFGSAKSTPRYGVFLRDQRQISEGVVVGQPGFQARLDQNRQRYLEDFVTRPEFVAQYPQGMSG